MRRWSRSLVLGVLAAAGVVAPAQAQGLTVEGVWRNPKDSVHIELKPCGEQVCGYVVWASERAQAAARRRSPENLVGRQLMRNFAIGPDQVGRGKVFVPDLNATFSGTAVLIGPRTLRARGCVLGNVVCKSQVWTRIDAAPG